MGQKRKQRGFWCPYGLLWWSRIARTCWHIILNQLKDTFEQRSVGVYRDDDLAVVKGLSGSEIERIKKGIVKVFKDCGLKISIKGELKIVNFLDVTFNLHKNTYEPYRKSDKESVYINLWKPQAQDGNCPNLSEKKVIRMIV